MKYLEKHFTCTSKLFLGVTGRPPRIGRVMQIRVAENEVFLKVKIVHHPRRDLPAEAIEL
jgi:hypothetical protein